jgi:hypothetical protein
MAKWRKKSLGQMTKCFYWWKKHRSYDHTRTSQLHIASVVVNEPFKDKHYITSVGKHMTKIWSTAWYDGSTECFVKKCCVSNKINWIVNNVLQADHEPNYSSSRNLEVFTLPS